MPLSETLQKMFGGTERFGDPAARTFELKALDGVHPDVSAALLARAQGMSPEELATARGITVNRAKHLMTEAGHALQGAMPDDWANHFCRFYPGLLEQMRED